MKLDTIGCIFYFELLEDESKTCIEVHFASTETASWAVVIVVDNEMQASFGSALTPNDHNAHNLAWEHLSSHKNPSNEKTNTTDQP